MNEYKIEIDGVVGRLANNDETFPWTTRIPRSTYQTRKKNKKEGEAG